MVILINKVDQPFALPTGYQCFFLRALLIETDQLISNLKDPNLVSSVFWSDCDRFRKLNI